jgi:predicted lipoprotein with Yx(FWY)xxD motif
MTSKGSISSLLHRSTSIALLAVTVGVGVGGISAGAATKTLTRTFDKATVQGNVGVLTDATHHALYVLSVEKGGHLHCTAAACLTAWPPLLVKSTVVLVASGKGVKGTFGEVKRSATEKQITFNGYPVYTFSGDSGSYQANGQGIRADGGTWTLINAGAKRASTTRYSKPKTVATTTTVKYGY